MFRHATALPFHDQQALVDVSKSGMKGKDTVQLPNGLCQKLTALGIGNMEIYNRLFYIVILFSKQPFVVG